MVLAGYVLADQTEKCFQVCQRDPQPRTADYSQSFFRRERSVHVLIVSGLAIVLHFGPYTNGILSHHRVLSLCRSPLSSGYRCLSWAAQTL